MPSSRKKVIIRRLTGDALAGYLPAAAFVHNGRLDLLDLTGRIVPLALAELKLVHYVRDFNTGDTVNPERLLRRSFIARPRTEGLWLRLTFRTGDLLEGLAPTDTSLLDGLVADGGIFLTPPDIRANTQRVFVPRAAIAELQVLAVITTPSRRKPLPAPTAAQKLQEELFQLPLDPDSRPN